MTVHMDKALMTGKKSRIRDGIACVVSSNQFSYAMCVLLLGNAITIGMTVNFTRENSEDNLPGYLETVSVVFCFLFVTELGMRMYVYGISFFTRVGWQWNVFDFIVVSVQVLEEVASIALGGESKLMEDSGGSVSIVRLLRFLRLFRIIRVLRVVAIVHDLRKVVYLIMGSIWSFFWTLMLLFLLTYIIGVFVTQLVADHGRNAPETIDEHTAFGQYYGSVAVSVFTLYQSISGGLDWADAANPLVTSNGWVLGVAFSLYISFAVLVMLNLVTGVFVEQAQRLTQADRERSMLAHVKKLFTIADEDGDREISPQEFCRNVDCQQFGFIFEDLNLSLCDADDIFSMIDVDGNGAITPEEFVTGATRLRGPARAFDLYHLVLEVKRLVQHVYFIEDMLKGTASDHIVKSAQTKVQRRMMTSQAVFRNTFRNMVSQHSSIGEQCSER